jgi:hypothetical protein
MQVYRCKVRLAGSLLNEVWKDEATAPEIILLRAMHGDDAVVEITRTSMDKRPHAEERERLKNIYGAKIVLEQFGHPHQQLPVRLDDHEEPVEEAAPEAESLLPPAPVKKGPFGRPLAAKPADISALIG